MSALLIGVVLVWALAWVPGLVLMTPGRARGRSWSLLQKLVFAPLPVLGVYAVATWGWSLGADGLWVGPAGWVWLIVAPALAVLVATARFWFLRESNLEASNLRVSNSVKNCIQVKNKLPQSGRRHAKTLTKHTWLAVVSLTVAGVLAILPWICGTRQMPFPLIHQDAFFHYGVLNHAWRDGSIAAIGGVHPVTGPWYFNLYYPTLFHAWLTPVSALTDPVVAVSAFSLLLNALWLPAAVMLLAREICLPYAAQILAPLVAVSYPNFPSFQVFLHGQYPFALSVMLAILALILRLMLEKDSRSRKAEKQTIGLALKPEPTQKPGAERPPVPEPTSVPQSQIVAFSKRASASILASVRLPGLTNPRSYCQKVKENSGNYLKLWWGLAVLAVAGAQPASLGFLAVFEVALWFTRPFTYQSFTEQPETDTFKAKPQPKQWIFFRRILLLLVCVVTVIWVANLESIKNFLAFSRPSTTFLGTLKYFLNMGVPLSFEAGQWPGSKGIIWLAGLAVVVMVFPKIIKKSPTARTYGLQNQRKVPSPYNDGGCSKRFPGRKEKTSPQWREYSFTRGEPDFSLLLAVGITCVAMLILAAAAGGSDSKLRSLSALWYKDPDRVGVYFGLLIGIFASLGLAVIFKIVHEFLTTKLGSVKPAGVCAVILVCFLLTVSTSSFQLLARTAFVSGGQYPAAGRMQPMVSISKNAGLKKIGENLNSEDTVLVDPLAGGLLLQAYSPATTVPYRLTLGEYPTRTMQLLNAFAQLPSLAACRTFEKNHITAVITDSALEYIYGPPRLPSKLILEPQTRKLFTKIGVADTAILWRFNGCAPLN